jgi:alkylation response protein AidB-like acyl-CoA dehydrogenase
MSAVSIATPPAVTFALTEEQQALAAMVRDVLADTASSDRIRAVMLDEGGFDAGTWDQLAQLGLTGLTIAEEHGGAGATFVELSLVFEELGRRLAPVPLLASAVLGATVLQHAGSPEQQTAILPDVAAGTARLALAHLDPAGRLTADPGIRAVREGERWTLDGTAGFVVDGQHATHLVVAATSAEGLQLFLVDADAEGVERTAVEVLDLTRPMATIRCSGVTVDAGARLGAADPAAALDAALTAGVVALACEQVGGTRQLLEMTTAYARDRVQFGRSIGSFQAVKHRLAELLVATESARSAAYHAARVLAAGEWEELRIAAPLAASYCAEVYERAAGDAIQLHGGIGFTWEHDTHLYFKRAKASKLLLGDPKHHRRQLADALGL